ncbi:hypothetical protein TURU_012489 [Turdus rufiventris]|nr:hypothetical protein TURU_012489 [Turdus rufiventris]
MVRLCHSLPQEAVDVSSLAMFRAKLGAQPRRGDLGGCCRIPSAVARLDNSVLPVPGERARPHGATAAAGSAAVGSGSAAGSGPVGSGSAAAGSGSAAGSGPVGSGPAGSGPAGSGSAAGSGPVGSGSAAGSVAAGSGSAAGSGPVGSGSQQRDRDQQQRDQDRQQRDQDRQQRDQDRSSGTGTSSGIRIGSSGIRIAAAGSGPAAESAAAGSGSQQWDQDRSSGIRIGSSGIRISSSGIRIGSSGIRIAAPAPAPAAGSAQAAPAALRGGPGRRSLTSASPGGDGQSELTSPGQVQPGFWDPKLQAMTTLPFLLVLVTATGVSSVMDSRGQPSPPRMVFNHQHLHLHTSKPCSLSKRLKSCEVAPHTESCGCREAVPVVSQPAFVGDKRLPGTSEHPDSGGTGKMHLAGPDTPSPSTPPWISIGGLILLAGLSRIGPIQMAELLEVSLLVATLWPLCWTRVSSPLKRRRLATSNSSATLTEQECRVNKAEVAGGQLPV